MTLSDLSTYFLNKRKELLPTLGSKPEITETAIVYPRPWADPRILSKTKAYQIIRDLKFPVEFEAITRQVPFGNIKLCVNERENYLSVIVDNEVNMFSYLSDMNTTQLTAYDSIRFFNLLTRDSALSISVTGLVCYWKDIRLDNPIRHQIPLFAMNEQITAVEIIDANEIVIGSSTGEIYLLTMDQDQITMSTIYLHLGILSYMSGLFRSYLPCRSNTQKPDYAEHILKVKVIGDTIYCTSQNYISIWYMQSDKKIKFGSHINIETKIACSITAHIPSNLSDGLIKSEIIDSNMIRNEEIVVLASYSLPDLLNDYVQYALVAFILNPETSTAHVKYTVSIPYAAIPDMLKSKPRISITDALAFISFDDSVVAVSLTRKSIFEESVVLKNDYVLYTRVKSDKVKNIDTAVIYTMDSGILEFQIDINEIHGSSLAGNLYASIVENERLRNNNIFKSKFQQAVIYGAPDESPLAFPLRPEEGDISSAAMDMSMEIMKIKSTVLPSRNDCNIYIESRYVFEKRIMKVLNENCWMSLIPKKDRYVLMLRAETYYISQIVWNYNIEIREESSSQSYWRDILSGTISVTKDTIQDLSIDYVFRTIDFIGKVCSDVSKQKTSNVSEHMRLFKSTNELLLRTLKEAICFEEIYESIYMVDTNTVANLISAQLAFRVFSLFKSNVEFILNINNTDTNENMERIKEQIRKLGSLSLDIALDEISKSTFHIEDPELEYRNVRKIVMEGLCKLGLYQIAIVLAQKHNDIPALIMSIQSSDLLPHDIQETHIRYIKEFGQEYFACLLRYLDKNEISKESDKRIMELLNTYPNYASYFLDENELKISWIYHHRQNNYRRSLDSLEICIENETNQEKLDQYQSWKKILTAAL